MNHAILSPSSAHRWIHCPPSAKINAEAPRSDTVFTREGTLAHSLAEAKANRHFAGADVTAQLQRIQGDELYQDEMDDYTDIYLEVLKDIFSAFREPPHVAIEQKVDISEYVQGAFGTCDCLMVGNLDEKHEMLQVIDFKYGKGVPVSAEKNPQLMLYALGALLAYEDFYDIGAVGMTIVQPRIKADPDTWTVKPEELKTWAETIVKPAAALAAKGEGDFREGEWCRFCAIRGSCRARALANLELARMDFKTAPEMTPAEIGLALQTGARLKTWLSDLETYALSACLDGGEIPGFKAVAGRSVRSWTDPEAAIKAAIAHGVPEAVLYERKPVTLAALEKTLGKREFNDILGRFAQLPPGKPTLVPDTDKRAPVTNRTTAAEDFAE